MEKRNAPQDWQPCQPGQLRRLAVGLRTERVRRRMRVIVGASTVTLVIAGLCLTLAGPGLLRDAHSPATGIACEEARGLFEAFVSDQLTVELAEQVRLHLLACEGCNALFSATYPGSKLVAWFLQDGPFFARCCDHRQHAVPRRPVRSAPDGHG